MHLFTCQCGESFPISPPQAGQTVQCPHCREAISLPNSGELKQLPEAQLSRREASAGSWSSARGIVFSLICAGLLAMLTASAWSTYGWLSIPKPPTRDEMIAQGQ